MLQLQDVVFVSGGKDKAPIVGQYTKTYFTYGAGDDTETVGKQFNGVANAATAVVPKGNTKVPLDVRFNEMLDYIGKEFAGDPKNPTPAQETILALVEKGLDLTVRASVGASLRPKEIDVDKTILKTAAGLVALKMYPTLEAAVAAIKAQQSA